VRPFPSLGYKVNGGFADYLAVPENIFRLGFVNPIPESLSFEQAAMSEIVACCLNAQENTPVHAGDYVLIFGAGPAGLVHAILSHRRGARRVVVTQRSRQRLERIRQGLPIDRVIVSQDEDLDQIIWEETAGEGADVIYVCAPSREAQESATRLAAPRGRINFFGGLPRDDCVIHLDANALHYKEFFVGGASSSLPEGNRQALHLLADRTIDPDRLITHRFPLEDIHKGFAVMEAREALKVVICPWAS
jgi:L-iditol 2-dehydrogenase